MTKKTRLIRIIVNSVLVVAIVALAVTVYQAGTQSSEDESILPQVAAQEDGKLPSGTTVPMVDAGTADVEAEVETQTEETAEAEASTENAQAEEPHELADAAA